MKLYQMDRMTLPLPYESKRPPISIIILFLCEKEDVLMEEGPSFYLLSILPSVLWVFPPLEPFHATKYPSLSCILLNSWFQPRWNMFDPFPWYTPNPLCLFTLFWKDLFIFTVSFSLLHIHFILYFPDLFLTSATLPELSSIPKRHEIPYCWVH